MAFKVTRIQIQITKSSERFIKNAPAHLVTDLKVQKKKEENGVYLHHMYFYVQSKHAALQGAQQKLWVGNGITLR